MNYVNLKFYENYKNMKLDKSENSEFDKIQMKNFI